MMVMSVPLHHLLIKNTSKSLKHNANLKSDKFLHFLTLALQENRSEVKPLAATQELFPYTYL